MRFQIAAVLEDLHSSNHCLFGQDVGLSRKAVPPHDHGPPQLHAAAVAMSRSFAELGLASENMRGRGGLINRAQKGA